MEDRKRRAGRVVSPARVKLGRLEMRGRPQELPLGTRIELEDLRLADALLLELKVCSALLTRCESAVLKLRAVAATMAATASGS